MFYAIAQTLQRTFAARALRMGLVAGLSGIVISACGGGAQTTDNPITSVTPKLQRSAAANDRHPELQAERLGQYPYRQPLR
jgi:hypothetical protein